MKLVRNLVLVVLLAISTGCIASGPTPVSNAGLKPIPTASAADVVPNSVAPQLQLEVAVPQLPPTEFSFSSTGLGRLSTLTPANGQAACAFVLVPKEVVRPLLRTSQYMGTGKGYQINELPLVSGNLLILSEGPAVRVVEMTSSWAYSTGKGTVEECFSWARARAGSSVRTGAETHFYTVLPNGTIKEVNIHDDRGG